MIDSLKQFMNKLIQIIYYYINIFLQVYYIKTMTKDLGEIIKKNRPALSPNSVKTYVSYLRNLYFKEHERGTEIDPKWFNNQEKIIELLKDKDPKIRKTIYASLIAVCDEEHSEKYKDLLMKDGKEYEEWVKRQEKTQKQKDNWKNAEDIYSVVDAYATKAKHILNGDNIDNAEMKRVVDYIILAITTGRYFPPRRSQDWVEMRIRGDYDPNKDNYITKTHFVFNTYKTAKKYERQTVPIPKDFKPILMKYIKINPTDYLIFDTNKNKMTASKLTQKLNTIFDAKISTSMLRHIYLTSRLKDIPRLSELQDLAEEMGHSVEQQLEYIKH